MGLTAGQIDQFNRDGFLAYGPILTLSEVNRLLAHYADIFIRETSRNIREQEDGETQDFVHQIMGAHRLNRAFGKLVRHPKILDLIEPLIGPNIQVFSDQALYKPPFHGGEVPWHQDNAYWQCDPSDLVSCWIALGDVTEDSGAMRFVPGTHTQGIIAHKRGFQSTKALQEVQADVSNSVTVELPAGGCSLHHCLILHNIKPNITENPRPGIAVAYMPVGTRDREGNAMADHVLVRESLKPVAGG
jgi:ectoine hydroxylase-related dioxygenase (phytanoyl-CoA dioxygenase family)